MILVTCPSCSMTFKAPDGSGGKRAKCPNCGTPIVIPGEQAVAAVRPAPQPAPQTVAAPAMATAVPAGGGGTTVIVQMQQPAAPTRTGKIGPANKSFVAVVFMWLIPLWGMPYFYLGQTGKGLLFMLVDLFLVGPLIFITCGLALAVFIPLFLLTLVDALVVTSRIRKGPISSWRFF